MAKKEAEIVKEAVKNVVDKTHPSNKQDNIDKYCAKNQKEGVDKYK